MTAVTSDIMKEFVDQVDIEKEYNLKELKQILSDIYKTKSSKAVKPKQPKEKPVPDTDSDDDKPKKRGRPAKVKLDKDGNPKVKKAPSAYNNFVKERIQALKQEQDAMGGDTPKLSAKDLMKVAAGEWKGLTKQEQEKYKM